MGDWQGAETMATLHDWIEDIRREGQRAPGTRHAWARAMEAQGASPKLAGMMAELVWMGEADLDAPLRDTAEQAALGELVERCNVDTEDAQEMALARKQAGYARVLNIRFGYLVANLKRDLARLDARRSGGRRVRRPRPHYSLGTLTPAQRRRAEQLWAAGPTHGLSWHEAMLTSAREDPAVYRRAHRIIEKARQVST